MTKYIKSVEGSNHRTLVDQETGELFYVVKLITSDDGERLVTATSELPNLVSSSNKRRNNAPQYNCIYPEFRRLMMRGDFNVTELKVLFFLMDNMPWGNRIQVTQRVISDSLEVARPHVSRAIKGLIQKEVVVEDVDPLVPNTPVYLIDPALMFNGTVEEREFRRKIFWKKYRQAANKRPFLRPSKQEQSND